MVCSTFNNLIPKVITVIRSNRSEYAYFNISPFLNLKECYLHLTDANYYSIEQILGLKVFTIDHVNIQNDWISYWMDPKRTQTEFNSISHSFTIKLFTRLCYSYHITCYNLHIMCLTYDSLLCDFIAPLLEKYYIIFDIRHDGELNQLNNKFGSKIYGLKYKSWDAYSDPFKLLIKYQNINYLEIEHITERTFTTGSELFHKHLHRSNICEREIVMKFPFTDLTEIYDYFPNAQIIST